VGWLATNTASPRARRCAEVIDIDNEFNNEVDNNDERIIVDLTFASNQTVSSMNQYKSAIIWHYKEIMSILDECLS